MVLVDWGLFCSVSLISSPFFRSTDRAECSYVLGLKGKNVIYVHSIVQIVLLFRLCDCTLSS